MLQLQVLACLQQKKKKKNTTSFGNYKSMCV